MTANPSGSTDKTKKAAVASDCRLIFNYPTTYPFFA
jgi:hypothetical protein